MAVVARTESPGLSRFILPILGLIAAGSVRCRDPRPVRPARRAEPPRLDLRRARQHVGRHRPAQRSGRPGHRQAPPGGDRPGGGRRRHLAAVHRRGRSGQPAPGEMARPDPAMGLRRPRPGAAGRLPGLPRGGNHPAQLPGRQGRVHARELRGDGRAGIHPDPAQQRASGWSSGPVPASSSGSSSPGCSIGSDANRWPRPSSSCRWRSRWSAHRSSGASSTRGSPPASRRSGS